MDKLSEKGFNPELLTNLLQGKNRDPMTTAILFISAGMGTDMLEPMIKNINLIKQGGELLYTAIKAKNMEAIDFLI